MVRFDVNEVDCMFLVNSNSYFVLRSDIVFF